MPNYKGHLVGGAITYLGILQIIKYADSNIHIIFQGLLFCLLGSLFPDVDIKSKGQQIFYRLLFVFLLYCLIMHKVRLFIIVALLGMIPMLLKHRGLFHRIWFLLLVTLAGIGMVKYLHPSQEMLLLSNCWFFFAGCLSHVLLDQIFSKMKRYFVKR